MLRCFVFVVVINVISCYTSAVFQHSYTKLQAASAGITDSHFSTTRTSQADHRLSYYELFDFIIIRFYSRIQKLLVQKQ